MPRPRHCSDANDERRFGSLGSETCSPELHAAVAIAFAAFVEWWAQVLEALDGLMEVRSVDLLHPTPGRAPIHVPLLDPSSVLALVARARYGTDGDTACSWYVGLVRQEVTAQWGGVAGFFIPFCGSCDIEGQDSLRRIWTIVDPGAHRRLPEALPAAVRPRVGWFESRLQGGVRVGSTVQLRTSFWQQARSPRTLPTGPGILCVGPSHATLANLVIVSSVREDAHAVLEGTHRAVVVSYRCGELAWSRRLLGLDSMKVRAKPVDIRRAFTRLPSGWGYYEIRRLDHMVEGGVTPDVCLVARDRNRVDFTTGDRVEFTPFTGDSAAPLDWTVAVHFMDVRA